MKKADPRIEAERARYVLDLAKMITSREYALFACGLGPAPAWPKVPRLPSPEHELRNLRSILAALSYLTDALNECIRFIKKSDWPSAAARLNRSINIAAGASRELRRLRRGRGQFSKLR